MTAPATTAADVPVGQVLASTFLLNHPRDAARRLEAMSPQAGAGLLAHQPVPVSLAVIRHLSPGAADNLLHYLPDDAAGSLLAGMDPGQCAALMGRLEESERERFLSLLSESHRKEVEDMLRYPPDTVGAVMETDIVALNESLTVADAIERLRLQSLADLDHLYLLTDDMYLSAQVPVQRLALSDPGQLLQAIAEPLSGYAYALDPKSEALDKLELSRLENLPVLDGNDQFIGVVRSRNVLGDIKQSLATEMLTMVGASKEERALSSSWFAVKKRLPWLQINLLTAFLAAAVVGMFEDTISRYTALAILLPIAAGQSGNTGAQSLAVTMRGLTLREITVRHWLAVVRKEAGAAVINGIAIAITCGAGVYLWSQSTGLALIIGLAMVSSMLLAAVAGALVPIVLKKLGQDPALSSSIILTTVTDIAGFMSFLGIATALSFMLDAS